MIGFFSGIGMQELIVIFLVVLLLFGAKRIPDIATGIGRGIRDFKKAVKETKEEIISDDSKPEKLDEKKND